MADKETFSNCMKNLCRQSAKNADLMAEPSQANPVGAFLLGVALIAAGVAGNYFKFPIFLDIDFLFGSIFAMLALQFFGLGRGILAAAIISAPTYFFWNHPYSIIIMTAEVAVVGWLMDRRKMGMVAADTIYWLFIGIPLLFFIFYITMHVPFSNTAIVMIKQTVNGIANALAARLIFTGYALRSRSSLTTFSEIIYNLLAMFVLCPAMITLVIDSRTDFAETDRQIRTELIQDSQLACEYLETWVANRQSAVVKLAEMAVSESPERMQSYLELIQQSDANFLRIGLLDRRATITAYFPVFDELGQRNIGKNFADRPFIPTLKQTLRPMLSEVVMGRIGIPRPMTTMLSPVVMGGEYGGYVSGILSMEQIRKRLNTISHENTTLYSLIDKNGNVIMTNRNDQAVMTPFDRGKGTMKRLDTGISQWVPVVSANSPVLERWKDSSYVAETAIGIPAEWKLILEQPMAPFQKTIFNNYTGKLSLLFLILLVALVLAELLSRWSIVTLEKLSMITHDLPDRLTRDGKQITWPESSIKEAIFLINNFRKMADSLTEKFNGLQNAQEELKTAYAEVEKQVWERTAELDASNASLTVEIAERKRVEEELLHINETLEQRVIHETAKNMEHERILVRQSRLAAMGEMIGNIAHQWRQPLNALGMLLFNIKDAYRFNTLDAAYLDQAVADGNRLVQKMSTTISDFSNFFRPDKEIFNFSALKQIREAVALMESSFQNSHIAIHIKAPQDLKLRGFPNEYSQVLLNLLSNARDAILSQSQPLPGRVDIRLAEQDGQGCVSVSDNGGGIPAEVLDRIFDPYFSTKEKGSGIGLYMSKMIIERNMNGSITANNIEGGVEFRICAPLAGNEPHNPS